MLQRPTFQRMIVALTMAMLSASLPLAPARPAQPGSLERFALLVGVNDYAEPSQKNIKFLPSVQAPGPGVLTFTTRLSASRGTRMLDSTPCSRNEFSILPQAL
jgi:hypothetical protein